MRWFLIHLPIRNNVHRIVNLINQTYTYSICIYSIYSNIISSICKYFYIVFSYPNLLIYIKAHVCMFDTNTARPILMKFSGDLHISHSCDGMMFGSDRIT